MLAILIPYYKIDFFRETLDSLASQTNKNFTVYIGNDASPIDPKQLLREYREKLTITYGSFDKNLGNPNLPKHWDRCLKMLKKEEWVMILGDDDLLEEHVVESWYALYNEFKDKTRVVRFATSLINENSESVSEIHTHPGWESAAASFYRKFEKSSRSSLSEYIFSRKGYEQCGFKNYPLGWHTDDRAWFEFSEKLPIYTINRAKVFIRVSPVSISGQTESYFIKNKATRAFLRFLLSKELPAFTREQQIKLKRTYEYKVIKEENLKFIDWIFLLYFYLRNSEFYHFKRIFKSGLKAWYI